MATTCYVRKLSTKNLWGRKCYNIIFCWLHLRYSQEVSGTFRPAFLKNNVDAYFCKKPYYDQVGKIREISILIQNILIHKNLKRHVGDRSDNKHKREMETKFMVFIIVSELPTLNAHLPNKKSYLQVLFIW